MINTIRTNQKSQDFLTLVSALDTELALRDGDDTSFYSQFNSVQKLDQVIVLFENEVAVGCGALKSFSDGVVEIKRMYVKPEKRGLGFASKILRELENWAVDLSCKKCILETGKRQPEAIALYKKNGYSITSNYGPYHGVENSVCFAKNLNK